MPCLFYYSKLNLQFYCLTHAVKEFAHGAEHTAAAANGEINENHWELGSYLAFSGVR